VRLPTLTASSSLGKSKRAYGSRNRFNDQSAASQSKSSQVVLSQLEALDNGADSGNGDELAAGDESQALNGVGEEALAGEEQEMDYSEENGEGGSEEEGFEEQEEE